MLGTSFRTNALEKAIVLYGTPQIFNTDQGSQFTPDKFTGFLKKHNIRISMDGQGIGWIAYSSRGFLRA